MIEIYFGSRILYLTDEFEPFYAQFKDRKTLMQLVLKFAVGDYEELYIYSSDLNNLYQNFKSIFIYEKAAGGLVLNSLYQVLLIKNNEVWQLPKGHVEKGETYTEAAIREVIEECSIKNPTIIEQLPSTFHTFKIDDVWHLKRTYWFKMIYKGSEKPKPQAKEGITEAKWVDKYSFGEIYSNTYKNLMKIFEYI